MHWVDDSNSKYYNKLVEVINDRNYPDNKLNYIQIRNRNIDWKTSEHLYDYKIQYGYAIEIKYNEKCIKEKGSAIFMHVSTDVPTAGCIAIPENDMIKILRNLEEGAKIYIR